MSMMVLEAAFLSITGPGDISNRCSKIELTAEVEEKDITTFADAGWKVVTGGLASGQLAATLKQDLIDDGLDEDMWTLFIARATTAFEVRGISTTVGVSNPKYTGLVLPKSWAPVRGAVGDVAEVDISWPTSGAITRGTT